MKPRYLIPLIAVLCICALPAPGQFSNPGLGGGIGFGQNYGQTDLRDKLGTFHARAFLRYGLISHLSGELSAGLGTLKGADYETQLIPLDYRFVLSPFSFDSWNPFLYAGFGAVYFDVQTFPITAPIDQKKNGWTGYAPGGVGMQFLLTDNVALEMSGGLNYSLSKEIKGLETEHNDMWWTYSLGLTVVGEDPNGDADGDGLTNGEEKQLGTDKKNPDTDGDGLSDGAEVKHHNTNPGKADSDGDGLADGEEINTYKTNPNSADTDGDGLNDRVEVADSRTNPTKADSDDDGLNDGAEVNTVKTDPMKADTDGDGVSDGDEVNRYKSNPLAADTDNGTVNDGTEVNRGTDPLNPADDVPKKEELQVEVGKAIVLEGIVFATGKSDVTPESESVLEKAYNTLAQNPDIMVEIRGYTDNTGKRASNVKLSQARADAVKNWLVGRGIAAERITTKGFGPDSPVAPNTNAEGRQKNRRIEFFRSR
jgi:outer membrane protein OmpA-like peptidoglycan-associated protein